MQTWPTVRLSPASRPASLSLGHCARPAASPRRGETMRARLAWKQIWPNAPRACDLSGAAAAEEEDEQPIERRSCQLAGGRPRPKSTVVGAASISALRECRPTPTGQPLETLKENQILNARRLAKSGDDEWPDRISRFSASGAAEIRAPASGRRSRAEAQSSVGRRRLCSVLFSFPSLSLSLFLPLSPLDRLAGARSTRTRKWLT